MGRRVAVLLGVLVSAGVVMSSLVVRPAFACSCAEPTVAGLVGRNPQVAIALVRRIDRDGGSAGVGFVERTLRGELPPQIPLHLDDGGSCRPYLGVGQIATLSFEPAGGSWRTLDCGMLAAGPTFAGAYGDLQVDPDARGDPVVALATALPGTEVVLLDGELRVLATAALPDLVGLETCGDALLVTTSSGDEGSVVLLSLPDLEPVAERPLRRVERLLDTRCAADGTVTAVTMRERAQRTLWLYPNLFRGRPRELPQADEAVITGDDLLLLRGDNDGRRSVLSVHEIDSGATTERRAFDGLAAYSISASPDGEHVALRGYAEEPALLILHADTGAIAGRARGHWMPPDEDSWLGDDRLLLVNENRGMGDLPEGARVVDLQLGEVARLPALPPPHLIAGHGAVAAVNGAELAVATAEGLLRTSADPRTAAAFDVAVLGEVSPAEDGAVAPPLPEPTVPEPAGRRWLWVLAAAVVAVVPIGHLVRRRRAPGG